jgi:hypothetical protein
MAKHAKAAVGRQRRRRFVGLMTAAAAIVALVDAVASASSTTSEGIVSITPHSVASGASIAAGKSVAYVVSGGATTVPTDATRVQFSVTVSDQAKAGTLTAQPYLDAADASGDMLSWQAPKTSVSGTFLEPVGVSNKVAFTNTSSGTVTVTVKITGYSTAARLAARLDTVETKQATDETKQRADETTISSLQSTVASLSGQLATAQQNITSLSSRLSNDETLLRALPRITLVALSSNTGSGYELAVAGANLLPNTIITLHFTFNGSSGTNPVAVVEPDGSGGVTAPQDCGLANVYATGVDVAGDTVASNRITKGPGCP